MKKILVMNGPNLNMLGIREPDIYGHERLDDIVNNLRQIAAKYSVDIIDYQHNGEGALVDYIQHIYMHDTIDGIIINPGAYSHTSVAIRDALSMYTIPIVEVHISNIHAREEFRHFSYISAIATEVIMGHGTKGYELALQKLLDMIIK